MERGSRDLTIWSVAFGTIATVPSYGLEVDHLSYRTEESGGLQCCPCAHVDIAFPRTRLPAGGEVFTIRTLVCPFSSHYMVDSICIPSSVRELADNCFSFSRFLTFVAFESDAKLSMIGESAFAGCYSLESLCIPGSVLRIGRWAFLHCEPDAIWTEVGNTRFQFRAGFMLGDNGTVGIRYLGEELIARIPDEIELLGKDCLHECSSVAEIEFGDDCQLVQIGVFACSCMIELRSICIPASVEQIGHSAFYNCTELTAVTFEAESVLEEICPCTFQQCKSLGSICLPSSIRQIGGCAFLDCKKLTTVVFECPSQLEIVRQCAFHGCPKLTSLAFPESLNRIGKCRHFWQTLKTVRFESVASLMKLYTYHQLDLSGVLEIEIGDCSDDFEFPGFVLDRRADTLVYLRREGET
jgi:hypothetical protein